MTPSADVGIWRLLFDLRLVAVDLRGGTLRFETPCLVDLPSDLVVHCGSVELEGPGPTPSDAWAVEAAVDDELVTVLYTDVRPLRVKRGEPRFFCGESLALESLVASRRAEANFWERERAVRLAVRRHFEGSPALVELRELGTAGSTFAWSALGALKLLADDPSGRVDLAAAADARDSLGVLLGGCESAADVRSTLFNWLDFVPS